MGKKKKEPEKANGKSDKQISMAPPLKLGRVVAIVQEAGDGIDLKGVHDALNEALANPTDDYVPGGPVEAALNELVQQGQLSKTGEIYHVARDATVARRAAVLEFLFSEQLEGDTPYVGVEKIQDHIGTDPSDALAGLVEAGLVKAFDDQAMGGTEDEPSYAVEAGLVKAFDDQAMGGTEDEPSYAFHPDRFNDLIEAGAMKLASASLPVLAPEDAALDLVRAKTAIEELTKLLEAERGFVRFYENWFLTNNLAIPGRPTKASPVESFVWSKEMPTSDPATKAAIYDRERFHRKQIEKLKAETIAVKKLNDGSVANHEGKIKELDEGADSLTWTMQVRAYRKVDVGRGVAEIRAVEDDRLLETEDIANRAEAPVSDAAPSPLGASIVDGPQDEAAPPTSQMANQVVSGPLSVDTVAPTVLSALKAADRWVPIDDLPSLVQEHTGTEIGPAVGVLVKASCKRLCRKGAGVLHRVSADGADEYRCDGPTMGSTDGEREITKMAPSENLLLQFGRNKEMSRDDVAALGEGYLAALDELVNDGRVLKSHRRKGKPFFALAAQTQAP